jgi:hypothetical protein
MNLPNWAPPQGQSAQVNPRTLAMLDAHFLDANGRLKLLPAADYRKMPLQGLRIWANMRSHYGFPTMELVNWLKERIGGRRAIEIGAGNGNLGIHLGIPMTDSYQQVDDPETVAYFAMNGITPTRPPSDVEKEDGENAVRRRKPQVVVACYVTEKFMPRSHTDITAKGNSRGIRYDYIIERCETFILIGNEMTHGKNRALSLPHEKFHFPWLVTRSEKQEMNRIWVWDNKK